MTHATSTPHLSCSSLSLPLSAIRTYGKAMKHAISTPGLSCSSLSLFLFCSQEVGKKAMKHPKSAPHLSCSSLPPSFLQPGRGESNGARRPLLAPFACRATVSPSSFLQSGHGETVKHPTSTPHLSCSSHSLFRSAARDEGEAMKHPTSTPHLSCSCLPRFLSAVRKGASNEAPDIDATLVVQQYFPLPFCSQEGGKQ